MSLGSLSDDTGEFNPEINTTPLVDVMLVLLIIFLITMPVAQHAVQLQLPRAGSQPLDAPPRTVQLSIDTDGTLHWNNETLSADQLSEHLAQAAGQSPQPALHLRADRTTPYERVAQVLASAQSHGLSQIGFVTEPPH